jgi:hypothetical protein
MPSDIGEPTKTGAPPSAQSADIWAHESDEGYGQDGPNEPPQSEELEHEVAAAAAAFPVHLDTIYRCVPRC